MNVRLLGTGAADGIPGLFSNDEVSRWARINGGKDIRTRSAALVDGHLKIDLGPDTFAQMQRFGLDGRDWSGLVFTHSHEDHFAVSEVQYALFPFVQKDHLEFPIYGNGVICGAIRARYPDWPMELVETRSFLTYHHGPYRITPVAANHIVGEDCQNLLIENKGKTLLYASDTGVYPDETFEFLESIHVDCLVIECTEGLLRSTYQGHLDIERCVKVVTRLREQGTLKDNSQVYTTHHAHTGGARHCDLERELGAFQIEPGFDGMLATF
ncbi:MAG TPA: MBL fold metallo-hydrolase [Fimbriimonas sp.]